VAPILLIFLRVKFTRVYAYINKNIYFPDTLLTLYVYATEQLHRNKIEKWRNENVRRRHCSLLQCRYFDCDDIWHL